MSDGRKEVLTIVPGYRESKESWTSVLRDLRDRGLSAAKLLVADGHLGIWAALARVWPETAEQRLVALGGIHLTGVRRDPHQCSAADRHGRFAPGRSRLVGCPRRLGGSGGGFLGRRLAMRSWKRIGSWATASSSTR